MTPFSPVDVAVVCALPHERAAVCRALQLGDHERESRSGQVFWRGSVRQPTGAEYQVVVAQLHDIGNSAASADTTDVINIWRPNAILLVGIAAAVRDDQELGDVVVGTQIVWYEPGQVQDGQIHPELRVAPADAQLLHAAKTARPWVGRVAVSRPDGTRRRSAVTFGPISSGEKVVKDSNFRNTVSGMDRKMLAIEMEGWGFSSAVLRAARPPHHIVIRGVCDYADDTKNDVWQSYAAHAAASYARHLLNDWPIEPIDRQSEAVPAQVPSIPATRPGIIVTHSPADTGLEFIENRANPTHHGPPHDFLAAAETEILLTGITGRDSFNTMTDTLSDALDRDVRVYAMILHYRSPEVHRLRDSELVDIWEELIQVREYVASTFDAHPLFQIRYYRSLPPFTALMIDGDVAPSGKVPRDQQGHLRVQPRAAHLTQHAGVVLQLRRVTHPTGSPDAFSFFATDLRKQWQHAILE